MDQMSKAQESEDRKRIAVVQAATEERKQNIDVLKAQSDFVSKMMKNKPGSN
jgi:hypothetical protein